MADRKKPHPFGGEGRYEANPESNKVGLTPEEVFESEVPQERPQQKPEPERPKD
ncbi:hypothetical protein J7643_04095 [bacterium]|nr:hypothetical protein [bacterium]